MMDPILTSLISRRRCGAHLENMLMKRLGSELKKARGMTLVELMIVVAIIAVLAAIGGVSYTKYVTSAKIGKLKQYAMEVESAQQQYKSQNSGYYNLKGEEYKAGITGDPKKKWEQVLGFSHKGLESTVRINTLAGPPLNACSICEGVVPDFTKIWYAVIVTQDMDGDASNDPTTIVLHNNIEQPMVLNEGQ